MVFYSLNPPTDILKYSDSMLAKISMLVKMF